MGKQNGHQANKELILTGQMPERGGGKALVDESGNVINQGTLEAQLAMGFVVDTLNRLDATEIPCLMVVAVPTPQEDGTFPKLPRGELNHWAANHLDIMIRATQQFLDNLRAAMADTVSPEVGSTDSGKGGQTNG